MITKKPGGRRNRGFGKSLKQAGKNALRIKYRDGHFGTTASHLVRWEPAVDFWQPVIRGEFTRLTMEDLIDYAKHVARRVSSGEIGTDYGHNLLSSCNVVLDALRGDDDLYIRPSDYLPPRCNIRFIPPGSLTGEELLEIIDKLVEKNHKIVAAILWLCMTIGTRVRESSLLDCKEALKQAEENGVIFLEKGTKGGRPRQVPATEEAIRALKFAAELQEDRRNLVFEDFTYIKFYKYFYKRSSKLLKSHNIKSTHELRSTYACRRYIELTGCLPPCAPGGSVAPRADDRMARRIIAEELGHHRWAVTNAYLGRS